MKKLLNIRLRYLYAAVLLLFISINVSSQIQPYQQSSTAAYIDTAKYDSVAVPYVKGTTVSGVITNEDETNSLVVYFSKTDSVSRDANSYVLVGPGKRLKFSFQGRKIYRYASADSVFSQVVFGDGVDLGSGGRNASSANMNLYGYLHKDSLNGDYNFTGSVDLTDAVVTPSNNLYGYAHKDTANTFSKIQKFTAPDSSIIADEVKGLTGQTSLTLRSPGDGNQKITLNNSTVSSSITISPQSATGYSFNFDATGFAMNDARINWGTSSYGWSIDADTYLKRNSADNVGITTGGTERINIQNTEVGFNVPAKLKGHTTAQRDALTPQEGWVILNTTTGKFQGYVGGVWVDFH